MCLCLCVKVERFTSHCKLLMFRFFFPNLITWMISRCIYLYYFLQVSLVLFARCHCHCIEEFNAAKFEFETFHLNENAHKAAALKITIDFNGMSFAVLCSRIKLKWVPKKPAVCVCSRKWKSLCRQQFFDKTLKKLQSALS